MKKETDPDVKPLVYEFTVLPGYFIDTESKIYRNYEIQRNEKGKFCKVQVLGLIPMKTNLNRQGYECVTLTFPDDLFPDYEYKKRRKNSRNCSSSFRVHQLVMHTFFPYDQYPIEQHKEFIEYYRDITEPHKMYHFYTMITAVLGGIEVNHKEGYKSDNNMLELEYSTRKENARHSTNKLYNGNTANAPKMKKLKKDSKNNTETLTLSQFFVN